MTTEQRVAYVACPWCAQLEGHEMFSGRVDGRWVFCDLCLRRWLLHD